MSEKFGGHHPEIPMDAELAEQEARKIQETSQEISKLERPEAEYYATAAEFYDAQDEAISLHKVAEAISQEEESAKLSSQHLDSAEREVEDLKKESPNLPSNVAASFVELRHRFNAIERQLDSEQSGDLDNVRELFEQSQKQFFEKLKEAKQSGETITIDKIYRETLLTVYDPILAQVTRTEFREQFADLQLYRQIFESSLPSFVDLTQWELEESDIDTASFEKDKAAHYAKQMKKGAIYGPINSRRVGSSLGINPIMGGFACNFGCSYCQYGMNYFKQIEAGVIRFRPVSEIAAKLAIKLQQEDLEIDDLTICGPTEPTMHPKFEEMVLATVAAKDIYHPDSDVTMFTNSSGSRELKSPVMRLIDRPFLKLDAGDPKTFERINYGLLALKHEGRKYEESAEKTFPRIVENIREANVSRRIIQTAVAAGPGGNFLEVQDDQVRILEEPLRNYIEVLKTLKADEISLYSILYEPAEKSDVVLIPPDVMRGLLETIRDRITVEFEHSGIPCPQIKIDVDPTEKKGTGFGELQEELTEPETKEERELAFSY